MKKLLLGLAMVIMGIGFVPAKASAEVSVKEIVATGVEAAETAYESYVLSSIVSRAGAMAPSGSKGIVFEKLCTDKMNLENFLKRNGQTVKWAESSTDTLADLVVRDAEGNIVEFLQCKDATNPDYIRSIVKEIAEGKYEDATIVAPKESAELIKRELEKKGLGDVVVENAGISTKTTSRIAESISGNLASSFAKEAPRSMKRSAIIFVGLSVIESVINGDSFSEGVANVVIGAGEGAALGMVEAAIKVLTKAGIVALKSHGVNAVFLPVLGSAASIVAPTIILLGFEWLDEEYGLTANISYMVDDSMEMLADAYVEFVDETLPQVAQNVKEGAVKAAENTQVAVVGATQAVAAGTGVVLGDAKDFWSNAIDTGVARVRAIGD